MPDAAWNDRMAMETPDRHQRQSTGAPMADGKDHQLPINLTTAPQTAHDKGDNVWGTPVARVRSTCHQLQACAVAASVAAQKGTYFIRRGEASLS